MEMTLFVPFCAYYEKAVTANESPCCNLLPEGVYYCPGCKHYVDLTPDEYDSFVAKKKKG